MVYVWNIVQVPPWVAFATPTNNHTERIVDQALSFLSRNGYLPHGYCFTWQPELLWTMVGADLLIALAYFSIPWAIWHFVRRRGESSLSGVAWLFCTFIAACGTTHVMDVWTIWRPDYGWLAIAKAITALASVATIVTMWKLMPRALQIPSVGQLQSVIGSLEAEIIQRRLAEAHLAEAQEALVITLSSVGAGFMATDRAGRIQSMNALAESVTGCLQSQARGRLLGEVLVCQGDAAGLSQANPVDALMASGIGIDKAQQIQVLSAAGHVTELELKAALTHEPDGAVRGMVVVFRDMTRINDAEAQASKLAAIVESSQDAIVGKTLDGHITSWNQGARVMYGYEADEVIGQPIQMLMPPDRSKEEDYILEDLSAGLRVPVFETVRRRKDGRLIDVSITISPIRDAQGRIVGASKIARDISQRRQSEALRLKGQVLEAENLQIQEANRLKSEFLANMSHELRTPLNAIIGFADLLHAGTVPLHSPKHHEFLGYIGTSGRHLLKLINDVLDLSKVEAGKLSFHPDEVDLPELVQELVQILHNTADKQGVSLEVDLDPAVAHLRLDAARLKQVLYNYLSNAIKFTPHGGRVTLRARPEGPDHVRIEVQDTGIGIAAPDLARLFMAFQQLDSSFTKRHQGTGLGLALTRRMIEAQGGTVGVSSVLGLGSVFHLVLPRVVVIDDADQVSVMALGEASVAAAPAPRVLVIHDNPAQQARIQQVLTEAGYLVDAPIGVDHALAFAKQHTYEAITLDLVLQERSGLALLSSIRSEGPSASTPVVALSMPTSQAPQAESASFAVTDLLAKPIRADQVAFALSKIGLLEGAGRRVMVVDDDPAARALMQATLEAMHLEVAGVSGGRAALLALDAVRPDAIILDLLMPEFDGFQVLDALRQSPRWQRTPVFIWTSMLLTDEEHATLARSAHAILSKGRGELDALLDELRRWRPLGVATEASQ